MSTFVTMKYSCPKCGKSFDVTVERLIECEYRLECPSCHAPLQIVGDYAYIPLDDGSLDLTPHVEIETAEPVAEGTSAITPPPFEGNVETDPLFNEAVAFLRQCNAITPMMLRDRFDIPLERAQQIILQLEQAGIVGPYNGGGPRSILIDHNTNLHTPISPPQYSDGNQGDGNQQNNGGKGVTIGCTGCLPWLLKDPLKMR